MSANNWAVCPRCLHLADKERENARASLRADYGSMPAAQYEAALIAFSAQDIPRDSFITFREDYEISGAEEGTIQFSYSGHCNTCGLGLDFRIDRVIPGVTDE